MPQYLRFSLAFLSAVHDIRRACVHLDFLTCFQWPYLPAIKPSHVPSVSALRYCIVQLCNHFLNIAGSFLDQALWDSSSSWAVSLSLSLQLLRALQLFKSLQPLSPQRVGLVLSIRSVSSTDVFVLMALIFSPLLPMPSLASAQRILTATLLHVCINLSSSSFKLRLTLIR